MPRRLTDEVRAEILRLNAQGCWTQGDIVRKVGFCHATVRGILQPEYRALRAKRMKGRVSGRPNKDLGVPTAVELRKMITLPPIPAPRS